MVSWWPWGRGGGWGCVSLPALRFCGWPRPWLVGPACPQSCTRGAARCCDAVLGFVRARRSPCSSMWLWGRRGTALALQPLLSPSAASTNLCSRPAAIIEHVRDGSVVRALLLPDYYLVTVMLSGIKVRCGRCHLPACRACCHLSARGTGTRASLRGALPTPAAPPAIGCPPAPCLAQPLRCAHRCGAVTWGQQVPAPCCARYGMPWEGPGQLGEGWPCPIRRAQPLRGCWHLRGGGIWGQPGSSPARVLPAAGGCCSARSGCALCCSTGDFFFYLLFSPCLLNLAVFLAILSRTALGVCFRALVHSWRCLLGRVKGCVSTERPESIAVHTSPVPLRQAAAGARGTWGFPPPLLRC